MACELRVCAEINIPSVFVESTVNATAYTQGPSRGPLLCVIIIIIVYSSL